MSSRDWRERVQDILDAVAETQDFMVGMDYESFRRDIKTIRAVEMNFIVIGEAATAIPDEIQEEYPDIPWHLMRGMRNRIVHAYFAVDEEIMWATVTGDFLVLADALKRII